MFYCVLYFWNHKGYVYTLYLYMFKDFVYIVKSFRQELRQGYTIKDLKKLRVSEMLWMFGWITAETVHCISFSKIDFQHVTAFTRIKIIVLSEMRETSTNIRIVCISRCMYGKQSGRQHWKGSHFQISAQWKVI